MKTKPLPLLAALLGLAALTPAGTAQAQSGRSETRVTYDRHGHPIHWVREYQGRDSEGRPLFTWVRDERRSRDHRRERPETRVTYDRHGHPIHWVREYQGRDSGGRPLFTWVRDERRREGDHGHQRRDHRHDSRESRRGTLLRLLVRP